MDGLPLRLIPKGPRLLVKSIYDLKTEGGLHIPQIAQDKRKVARAEVLGVGDGVKDADGYQVGQFVFFMSGSAVAIDHAGETFMTIKVDEILAVEAEAEPGDLLCGRPDEVVARLDAEAFE